MGQGNFSGFLADGGGAGRYYVMRSKMPALAYLKKQIFLHEQKRLPFSRPGSGVKGQLLYLRGTRLGLRKKQFYNNYGFIKGISVILSWIS